jgi:AraC-like DNA-binding protein
VQPGDDVLSDVLRSVRLSGSLQFCFMPEGAWHTEGSRAIGDVLPGEGHKVPFHIVVDGTCWMKMEGSRTTLTAGDVVAFPFGTEHDFGVGDGGDRPLSPLDDLPPKPWRELPVLRYRNGGAVVRLLCGYLQCDALRFRPLRDALPPMLHVRTADAPGAAWLRATIAQIVSEADHPRVGGLSMLERLTEIIFIELLRDRILTSPGSAGWLAALADPSLGRCLCLIHEDPRRDWSVEALSAKAGMSRSALAARFETTLGTSPMRYVREWRLCLASVKLSTTRQPIATIADEAGYSEETAFSRAFARTYGVPPATWRQNAQAASATPAT